MTIPIVLSLTVLCSASLINCAPISDNENREGRQWNHGYGYSVYRPFPSIAGVILSRLNLPSYFGNGVMSSSLNGDHAASNAYGSTFRYGSPSRYADSLLSNRWQSVGIPSGSYSNVNTGSFSSANGINSYGSAGTRIATQFGSFPGLVISNGQLFNPGFGSSISGTGFSGSQFVNGGGFVGLHSRVTGGGFSGLVHSGSVSGSSYSNFPSQYNVISNTQSTATSNGNPINAANSEANMENSGLLGATSTNVKAVSKTTSEGQGYSTSSTHSEAQGYSDGETGTVNANVDTQSTSKGTASSESIGDADALAHGTTIGGKIKTNTNVTTDSEHEQAVSQDGREIVRASSVNSHAGGNQTRPASYTHVYNSGPIPETNEDATATLQEPNTPQNIPSIISIPITQVASSDSDTSKSEAGPGSIENVATPISNPTESIITPAQATASKAESVPTTLTSAEPMASPVNAEEPNLATVNAAEEVTVANKNPQKVPDAVTQPVIAETPAAESKKHDKPTNLQSSVENINETKKPGVQMGKPEENQTPGQSEQFPASNMNIDERVIGNPESSGANTSGNQDSAQGNDISDDYL